MTLYALTGSMKTATAEALVMQNAIDRLHGKNIHVNTYYSAYGGGVPAGAPGGGHVRGPGPGGAAQLHVHVNAPLGTAHQIGQAVQKALNQKTVRNGSTQLFLAGRLH